MRVTTLGTSDLDEARTILDRHFYPTALDPLTPGARWRARFDVTPPEPVTIGDISFGADMRLRFGELGAYHIDVPLSGTLAWRQGSGDTRVATTATAGVFQPVGDTTLERWSGDCRLLAVKIDRNLLEERLARLLDAPVPSPIRLGPTLDLSRGAGRTWLRILLMLAADAAGPDGLTRHPAVDAALRDSLVTGLLLATDHPYREQLANQTPTVAAPRTVRHVVEAMRAQPGRPFTVVALADIAGVSPRSLQQSFQRYLGMSPMAYLRQLRLGLAHEALIEADPADETVARVAYRFGFTHLGRFAAAYRGRYGTSPGQTLRR